MNLQASLLFASVCLCISLTLYNVHKGKTFLQISAREITLFNRLISRNISCESMAGFVTYGDDFKLFNGYSRFT